MPILDSRERNWLDLPRDAVLSIFQKLSTFDILIRPHNVCTTWREISKDPSLYRTIDILDLGLSRYLEFLCHRAIDYSCGQIIDISIECFGTNDLLRHIADNASHLRRLRLACCYRVTDKVLCEVAEKFSHLEELDICISGLAICPLKAIGRCCPRLKTLEFRTVESGHPSDKKAFDIELHTDGLRRIQLFKNKITNKGLLAILDGCPDLESLYMCQGFW